jgi:hypothetical protein
MGKRTVELLLRLWSDGCKPKFFHEHGEQTKQSECPLRILPRTSARGPKKWDGRLNLKEEGRSKKEESKGRSKKEEGAGKFGSLPRANPSAFICGSPPKGE